MILRKPYAVFIKYFRHLHAAMALFSLFVLIHSFSLYNFFRVYSIDYRSATSNFSSGSYLGIFYFFLIFLILILTIIFLAVAFYKNKPKKMYLYNLALYLAVLILYYFSSGALNNIEKVILDIKVAKAFRDISLIVTLLQVASFLFTLMRATGFDIKQFDFGTDLQKMDISTKDNEEFEVAVDFDKDSFIRNVKRNLRHTKYFFFEHKFIIISVSLIVFLALSFYIYSNIRAFSLNYHEGDTFTVSNATINVRDSYIVDSNIDGEKIVDTTDNPGAVAVVRLQLKGDEKYTFNTGLVTLKVGNFSYKQNVRLANKLYDLGIPYIDQKFNSEFTSYIFAFEIPSAWAHKSMKVGFNDNYSFVKGQVGAVNAYVKLKPKDLRKDGEMFTKKLTQTINFDDSILGSSSMLINSYEINNKFKLNYKFCYSDDKCFDSIEYLTAKASGNYFKTLLRINGRLIIDQNLNISDVYDFRTLVNNFGVLTYKVNNVWKSHKLDSEIIKPVKAQTDDSFIEIPYDAKDAAEMYITLNIRNQIYKYVLK